MILVNMKAPPAKWCVTFVLLVLASTAGRSNDLITGVLIQLHYIPNESHPETAEQSRQPGDTRNGIF